MRGAAARAGNFFCYLLGAWLLTGSFMYAVLLAAVTTGLSLVRYGWPAIQWFGIGILVAGILRVTGVLSV